MTERRSLRGVCLAMLAGFGLAAVTHFCLGKVGNLTVAVVRGYAAPTVAAALGTCLLASLLVPLGPVLLRRLTPDRPVKRLAALAAVFYVLLGYGFAIRTQRSHAVHSVRGIVTPQPDSWFEDDAPTRPRIRTSINALGFRGPQLSREKPTGTLRVAIVGDSFVFGSGVRDEHTLDRILLAALQARLPGRPIETVNLGIPGNNVDSHVRLVEVAEKDLSADLIILALTLPNDFSGADDQLEYQARREIGWRSFGAWLIGTDAAAALSRRAMLTSKFGPETDTVRDRAVQTLRAMRADHHAPPLVVFSYGADSTQTDPFAQIPNARIAPPAPWRQEHFIAGDGHPTETGNREFASILAPIVAEILAEEMIARPNEKTGSDRNQRDPPAHRPTDDR